ncbi:MAG: hypothetical protein QNK05_23640 [Myxococcota bacterium]|nr:hypothetical protein [Myxococcota bacterium]
MRGAPLSTFLLWAGLSIVAWLAPAGPAGATVTHSLLTGLDDASGARIGGDFDEVTAPTAAGITRSVFASFSIPQGQASGAIGPFGNLGVQGSQSGPGELFTQVKITSDEFVNRSSFAQPARLNFIVDGGSLALNTVPGGSLELSLSIRVDGASGCSTCFSSRIRLEDTSASGGLPTLTFLGADLGAVDLGNGEVEIPFSFQSADLGLVPPGGTLEIEYFLNIQSDVPRFAEILRYEFSDPLDVEGDSGERPVVVFSTPEAVPPLALLLLAPLVRAARARLG